MLKILFLSCLPFFALAQEEAGIKFEKGLTWRQVLSRAKRERKYIFIDCFTTWCAPCRNMDRNVYSSKKVGEFVNGRFIAVKVQCDTTRQDSRLTKKWYREAHIIGQKYSVSIFPTYLFLFPDGRSLDKEIGYRNESAFLALAKEAVLPDKGYYVELGKYYSGRLSLPEIKELAHRANSLGEKELAWRIANRYINAISQDSILNEDNVEFLSEFTKTSRDRGFSLLRDSADEIARHETQFSAKALLGVVKNIIYNEEIKPYIYSKNSGPDWSLIEKNVTKYGAIGNETYVSRKPGIIFKTEIEPRLRIDPDWTKIYPIIKSMNLQAGEDFVVGSTIVFYLNELASGGEGSCKNLVSAASCYMKDYAAKVSVNSLNDWAWLIFQHSGKREELDSAIKWIRIALDKDSTNSYLMDTYANLLYKTGDHAEALICEGRALTIAIARGEDRNRKTYEETLEKMRKGQDTW